MYAGAGGNVGVGAVMGDTDSLGGLSIGVGADIGFGPSAGGQVTVGFNDDWSVSSAGGAKGKGGGGFGFNIGVDFFGQFQIQIVRSVKNESSLARYNFNFDLLIRI